jgi:hypothetical protein
VTCQSGQKVRNSTERVQTSVSSTAHRFGYMKHRNGTISQKNHRPKLYLQLKEKVFIPKENQNQFSIHFSGLYDILDCMFYNNIN